VKKVTFLQIVDKQMSKKPTLSIRPVIATRAVHYGYAKKVYEPIMITISVLESLFMVMKVWQFKMKFRT
jgi:hypothetical protein